MAWLTVRQAADATGQNVGTLRKRIQRHPDEFTIMRRVGLPLLIEVAGVADELSLTEDRTVPETGQDREATAGKTEDTRVVEFVDLNARWLAHVEQVTRAIETAHRTEIAAKDDLIVQLREELAAAKKEAQRRWWRFWG